MNYTQIKSALQKNHDELGIKVLEQLRENAEGVTRARLVALNYPRGYTGISADRSVREAIKRLRNLGIVIISSTDRAGYRIAGKNETRLVRRYAEQQYKAARSRMATARRVLKAYGLQDNLRMQLGG